MHARDAAALASLERDHRLLWGLTEALGAYVDALDAERPLRRGDLRAIVRGLRAIADYQHFEKVDEVVVPALVRSGLDYNLELLDEERREHARVRHLIEVLHQAAEREPSWSLYERQRISRAARELIDLQRRLATREQARLFPEIAARLDPPTLGQLTEQLCHFDDASAARSAEVDVGSLTRSVLTHYSSTLPSARELAG